MRSNKKNQQYSRLTIARAIKTHRHHIREFWRELKQGESLNDLTKYHSNSAALLEKTYPTIYFPEY